MTSTVNETDDNANVHTFQMRENTRALLRRYLGDFYDANATCAARPDAAVISGICDALEHACVNKAVAFSEQRNFTSSWNNPRFRSLYNNVTRNVAVFLRSSADKVGASNTVDHALCHDIVSQDSHSMFPHAWSESVAAYRQRMQSAYQTRVHAKTTQFKCPKCKNNECDFYEMQCRSADESMTLFITCLTCNHKWRLG